MDNLLGRYVGYLGLAIGVALTPFVYEPTPAYLAGVFGTAAGQRASWTYVFVTRRPARAEDPRWGAVYVTGLIALMAALVYQSGFFGFQAFAGYVHSFAYLRGRGRWVGLVVHRLAGRLRPGRQPAGRAAHRSACWPAGSCCRCSTPSWPATFMYFSEFTSAAARPAGARSIDELNEANRQAVGDPGRERRPAGPAAGQRPRGRRARRAGPAGPRDPRHHRPGPHRGRHPARGGRLRRGRRRGAPPARRHRDGAGPGEPDRGPALGGGADPRPARPGPAARRDRRDGQAVGRDRRGRAGARHHRRPGPAAARAGGRAVPGGPGGAGERGQARRRARASA